MRERISKLHHNRIFALVFWLIVIFAAIVTLPNVNTIIQYDGQPQLANTSQPVKASQIRNTWGRNLNGTYTVNAVYNNPDGALTNKQLAAINKSVAQLQKRSSYYGIQKITTMTNTPTSKPQLFSKDKSTEIVQLAVSHNQGTVRQITSQLKDQIATIGLNTYVTSPEIVSDAANEHISSFTLIVILMTLLVALVAMGILFASIIAPIITFLAILISYISTLSLATNLAYHWNFAYSEYTPIFLLLGISLFTLLTSFWFYRDLRNHIDDGMESQAATSQVIQNLGYRVLISTLSLTLAFGSLMLFDFSTIRAYGLLGIGFAITGIASVTLVPVFAGMLGNSLFWPKKTRPQLRDHKMWHTLARFGMWQPWVAILVVAYLIGPFAYSYRSQLSYDNATDISNNQAVQGARVLSAHFGQGKATPVTLYLQTSQRLDNQNQLFQLDNLTKKLRAQPGVASVTSVTQPGGQPITQYYVSSQLSSIDNELTGVSGQLQTVRNDLKSDSVNLRQKALKAEIKRLQKLTSKTSSLVSDSSTLQSSIQSASSKSSASGSSSSKAAKSYIKQLNQVNTELSTALSTLTSLSNGIDTANTSATAAHSNLSNYATGLKAVNDSLNNSRKQVINMQKTTNKIYLYLDGLQSSEAAKSLYLSPTQIASGDFQQSLTNFTDEKVKSTYLTITLKQAPNAQTTAKTLTQLRQVAKAQLRGTVLKNATLTFAGQPVVTATIQNQYQHDLPRVLLLVFGITLLLVILFSRSLLQAGYWFLTFLASVAASYQLTHLIMKWLTGNGDFNWQVPLLAFVPVTVLGVVELTQLALSFRLNEAPLMDWLLPGLKDVGQTMRHSLFIIIAGVLGLLAAESQTLTAVTLITIFTAIIFNLTLPIMAAAFGKLSVVIPAQKPYRFRRQRRADRSLKSTDDTTHDEK
ncbi:multidrug RND transporter [Levilactobacillus brevis]|jgi:RND superfamily putative drug exporter|uniref:Predicted drug exporter of the RND superfamily n=3 Tax=Levilactobacillus brevis TaxID=1580 RepID=Q03PK3_LEVBA|nr:MMPL family transporter [Levilactobacillus brevis]ABJ64869.1 Predicted drug exporter of the RND superfamily [Levilactobacillus brevis ATCC 367]ARW22782.1 Putative membrane protein YdgH [Levilactobacillus brevis]KWT47131.1 multidrug RND transporter [Levilactobacillus brevis]MCB4356691.1 MMPL family transporter [Levilactobacillus brevis]MCM6799926.1 MMPL family transporter [Levilactobacillus brevis]